MSGVIRKGTGGGELTDVISMRLSQEDRELLDRVASSVPAVPRLTLARIALRIGLDAIRQNPARALAGGRRQAR